MGNSSDRTGRRTKLWKMIFPVWCALGLVTVLAPRAQAAFVGYYSANNFLFTNFNSDGSFFTPDAGQSIVLVGGQNGSGLEGTTDLTIKAAVLGIWQFDYSYSSLDLPGFDRAGYLLDGVFTELADTDMNMQFLTKKLTVNSGQTFGFRVQTFDNTGEPGILAIANFSAPTAAAQVPEPGTLSTLFIAGVLAGAVQANKRRRHT